MKRILIAYYSYTGHTARIVRTMRDALIQAGATCDMMEMVEICREGVDWNHYDGVIVGSSVIYGVYDKIVWEFVQRFHNELDRFPNCFFNVTVVARTPFKATVEGNRYMQRFLQKSIWEPNELKCIAGKVDYPHWKWYQVLAIRMIMKITHGPTDSSTIIDYTDWNDVKAYAEHFLHRLTGNH